MTEHLNCTFTEFQEFCGALGFEPLRVGRTRDYWAGDVSFVIRYDLDLQKMSLTRVATRPDLVTDVLKGM